MSGLYIDTYIQTYTYTQRKQRYTYTPMKNVAVTQCDDEPKSSTQLQRWK